MESLKKKQIWHAAVISRRHLLSGGRRFTVIDIVSRPKMYIKCKKKKGGDECLCQLKTEAWITWCVMKTI